MSLLGYTEAAAVELDRIARGMASLSDDDQTWIGDDGTEQLRMVFEAVQLNQEYLNQLVLFVDDKVTASTEQVKDLLKNIYREWTAEGASEREPGFSKLLSSLSGTGQRVLVPGGGLGRLSVQVAANHYCTHLDFDALKYVIFQDIIKRNPLSCKIAPFALDTCNRIERRQNVRELLFPDFQIEKSTLERLDCVATNFLEFSKSGLHQFDIVLTSFFIDCTDYAVTDVIRAVHRCLKPGGVWANFGGLCYAYDGDLPIQPQLELSADQILIAVTKLGFTVEEEELVPTDYLTNSASLMQTRIDGLFFRARK